MNVEQIIGTAKAKLAADGIDDALKYATELEALREPLLSLRVERYKELCKRREQYRHPKDKEYTDFDRRTMLEAAVADVQADYELVKGLEELVKERVDLLKLLMEQK